MSSSDYALFSQVKITSTSSIKNVRMAHVWPQNLANHGFPVLGRGWFLFLNLVATRQWSKINHHQQARISKSTSSTSSLACLVVVFFLSIQVVGNNPAIRMFMQDSVPHILHRIYFTANKDGSPRTAAWD